MNVARAENPGGNGLGQESRLSSPGSGQPQAPAVRRVRDAVCGTDRVQVKGWTSRHLKNCPRKWKDHGLWNQSAGFPNSGCVTLGKSLNFLSFSFIVCEIGLMPT